MGASGAFFLPLLGLWLSTQDDRTEPFYQARHNDLLVETAIAHTNHYQQNICLDHCLAHPGFHEEGGEKVTKRPLRRRRATAGTKTVMSPTLARERRDPDHLDGSQSRGRM